jgi:Sulfotransferase domain
MSEPRARQDRGLLRPVRHEPAQPHRRFEQVRSDTFDFIIPGTKKGGTSSLYAYLSQHPETGPTSSKEIHYFNRWYANGLNWYRAFFPHFDEARYCGGPARTTSSTLRRHSALPPTCLRLRSSSYYATRLTGPTPITGCSQDEGTSDGRSKMSPQTSHCIWQRPGAARVWNGSSLPTSSGASTPSKSPPD